MIEPQDDITLDSNQAQTVAAGFYGKLPSQGDFVQRRLPRGFVERFDRWLQAGMISSQQALGDQWLEVYLTSPLWRFALSAGVCGDKGWIGVLAPSVDGAGRYFPLIICASYPDSQSTIDIVHQSSAWLVRVEELLINAVQDPTMRVESFDQQILSLPLDLQQRPATHRIPMLQGSPIGDHWLFEESGDSIFETRLDALIAYRAQASLGMTGLWWSEGSKRVSPSYLLVPGLPEPENFPAMLDGSWDHYNWDRLPARSETIDQLQHRSNNQFDCCILSHPGNQRKKNEDSVLSRPDIGLWVVADGMGGHSSGEVASAMVVDSIRSIPQGLDYQELISQISDRIQHANTQLLEFAARNGLDAHSPGSTVAALVIGKGKGTAIWAGDSRIYRLRGGVLETLTRDHSLLRELVEAGGITQEEAEKHPQRNVITRAVGGGEDLDLECFDFEVQAADRFLVCSDGLYGELSERSLTICLQSNSAQNVCQSLIETVLAGSAKDNVSVIVVDIH